MGSVGRELREVVFVDGVRTAFGRSGPKGVFWRTRGDDLAVKAVREVLRRNPALPLEPLLDLVLAQEERDPLSGQVDDHLMDRRTRADIDALGRLVKNAYPRGPMQPAAEDCFLLVATGQSDHSGV